MIENFRKSSQYLMPAKIEKQKEGKYRIYPTHNLEADKIFSGFESLAAEISKHKTVIIDGYLGVFFEEFRNKLEKKFSELQITVNWLNVSEALKPESEIDDLIAPFLGGNDPLFGTRTTLELADFYDAITLKEFKG